MRTRTPSNTKPARSSTHLISLVEGSSRGNRAFLLAQAGDAGQSRDHFHSSRTPTSRPCVRARRARTTSTATGQAPSVCGHRVLISWGPVTTHCRGQAAQCECGRYWARKAWIWLEEPVPPSRSDDVE